MEDLLNHQPVAGHYASALQKFYKAAFDNGQYDFHSGAKLHRAPQETGYEILHHLILNDAEFCFDGPAHREVYKAWQKRFERLHMLREFMGEDFVKAFLDCLLRIDHHSLCRVHGIIARK